MSHFLDASQLAEVCNALDLDDEAQALIEAAQRAGEAIAKKLKIALVNDASNEPGFGGLCVGFGPAEDGQECPTEIIEFDAGSDWAEEGGGDNG